jgi:hypothetical protein
MLCAGAGRAAAACVWTGRPQGEQAQGAKATDKKNVCGASIPPVLVPSLIQAVQ